MSARQFRLARLCICSRFRLLVMSLYVFKITGTPFVKMGFTRSDPWRRVANGFWSNVRPPECCDQLGWNNCDLVALFTGAVANEREISRALPPTRGEFWHDDVSQQLLALMADLPQLPLPAKPASPPAVNRPIEKLQRCGGIAHACSHCDQVFGRWHQLQQHLNDVHSDTGRTNCRLCGKSIVKRNLSRHVRKACNKNVSRSAQ